MLSHVHLFATPQAAACQASQYFTISQSVLKLMSTITNYTWPKCRKQATAVHLMGQIGFVCLFHLFIAIFKYLVLTIWQTIFYHYYQKKKAYSLYTSEFVITGPRNWKTQVPLISQVPGSRNDAISQNLSSRTQRQRKSRSLSIPTANLNWFAVSPTLLSCAPVHPWQSFKEVQSYNVHKSKIR